MELSSKVLKGRESGIEEDGKGHCLHLTWEIRGETKTQTQ